MDREVVLFVLAAVLVGAAMPIGSLAASMVVSDDDDAQPGRTLERHALRRLLLPLGPAFLALAALFGWALVEPDDAERVPWLAFLAAVPALLVWLRAAARAVRALNVRSVRSAATVGLFRPRVVVGDDFHRQVDERALEAALAHEEAHARHRDPLRIWLGQIATDLQWPLPGAQARFEHWLFALELARDEEARAMVDGADLAAAVLAAARVEQPAPFAFAGIASAGAAMRLRVERLLAPMPPDSREGSAWLVGVALAVASLVVALLLGAGFGEALVRQVLGWGR